MQRKVIFDTDDTEGYCFDVERANEEGLVEDMRAWIVVQGLERQEHDIEMQLTDELFDALLTATELSVNVPPDTVQVVKLRVRYFYGYGKPTVPALPAAS